MIVDVYKGQDESQPKLAIPIPSGSVYCIMSSFFKVSRIAIPYHTLMNREMTN